MKKTQYKEFKQGIYKPVNGNKLLSKKPIIYRSGLELSVMLVLDKSSIVKKWGSEHTIIPYYKSVEKRYARYFMDFTVIVEINGKLETWLLEVKPEKQCKAPSSNTGNKKRSTVIYEQQMWSINQDKWEAAKNYADKKGYIFKLLTEKNIQSIL